MPGNGTFEPAPREAEAVDREMLIRMMSDIGNKMYLRLSAARFKERQTDDIFLKYVRAWSAVMTALNTAVRDEELTELQHRIEALEGMTKETNKVQEFA